MKKQRVALVLALLLSCAVLMAGMASASAASAPSAFPVLYNAFGNDYSVTGYSFTTEGEKGKTEITLYGNGYNKLPFRDGGVRIPVWCNFISGGKTYESISASVSSTQVVVSFDVTLEPEEIIIQNGDTWEDMATFKVADETAAMVEVEK